MPAKPAVPVVRISSSQRAMRVPRGKLADLVEFVARHEGVRVGEVDLAVVGEDEIARLNRRYLRHAAATDVLSFDLSDSRRAGLAAQIVVCGPVAVRQAVFHGQGPQRELMLYVVHGLLHLTGWDDTTSRGAARMHAREEELLGEFSRGPSRPRPQGRSSHRVR